MSGRESLLTSPTAHHPSRPGKAGTRRVAASARGKMPARRLEEGAGRAGRVLLQKEVGELVRAVGHEDVVVAVSVEVGDAHRPAVVKHHWQPGARDGEGASAVVAV